MASLFKWKQLIIFLFIALFFFFFITNNLFLTINYGGRIKTALTNGDELRLQVRKDAAPSFKRVSNRNWFDVIAAEVKNVGAIRIGLVNIDKNTIGKVRDRNVTMVEVYFDAIKEGEIPWHTLAPERIDENSTCLDLRMPRFDDYTDLDAVVARVPYHPGCENGAARDVFRLQVNLVVANLVARSGRSGNRDVFVVFVESCEPQWEIFRCKDVVWNEGNTWVYRPELDRIRQLVLLPIGPCQFVNSTNSTRMNLREAYVTVLHSSEAYVCGAIVLAQTLIQSNTSREMILLADDHISRLSLRALATAGWRIRLIERIRSPYSKKNSYNEWNYSKLRIWQLGQYDKLVFIDADLIINRNIDALFAYPELSASANHQRHLFNSGLMVVEPSECMFESLIRQMATVEPYNGGDQGFLNEVFAWWHRLPPTMNYLKVFVDRGDRLHWINGDDVHAVHYTGVKPWRCAVGEGRHDCNWDVAGFHRYASDSAHRMWWRVYRRMPEELKQHCELLKESEDHSVL